MAIKLDPTVGQLCFCRIFQTVRNLQKATTEMSSGGPKMVEISYGMAGNGLKWPKNQEITSDPQWPSPSPSALSGRVRRGLAVKFYGQDRPVVALLPVRHVYSSGGRNRLPQLKPDRPKNGLKRPNSGFSGFGDFLSGFGIGS